MKDTDCREFLDWALPRLGFRRAGFRHVRGQVCKRIGRRLRALDLPDHGAYRQLLDADPGEWATLDSFCRITISRFCRDRQVIDWLEQVALQRGGGGGHHGEYAVAWTNSHGKTETTGRG